MSCLVKSSISMTLNFETLTEADAESKVRQIGKMLDALGFRLATNEGTIFATINGLHREVRILEESNGDH